MRCLTVLVLFIGIMTVTPSFAHDGHTHIFGTIATLGKDHIVVKTKDGKTIPISVTGETTYRRQPAASGNATPQVGDRVIVEVADESGGLVASQIRFAPAGTPRP
jgi:hypothetical protein